MSGSALAGGSAKWLQLLTYEIENVFIDSLIKVIGKIDKGKYWVHHLVALVRFLNLFWAAFYHLKNGDEDSQQNVVKED